ncbi:MAG: tetratricopeptide repeat protein [Planctomycetes bacterium]|nr:tetratricopeptide repeat protein [Planctomycetota bacterium]
MRALLPLLLLSLTPSSCQLLADPDASHAREHFDGARAAISLDEAERRLDEGDVAAARRELDGIRAEPAGLRTLLLQARTLIAEGRFQEAELELGRAEALAAAGPETDLVRGTLEESRGRWKLASAAYASAAAKDPDSLELVLLHARSQQAMGDSQGAAALLERELGRRPDSFELLVALADAHLANGDPDLASNYLRRAADYRPRDRGLLHHMVLALSLAGRHAEAADAGIDLLPEELPDYLNLALGRSALAAGRPGQASKHLDAYLASQRGDAAAWGDLARSEYLLGSFEAAFRALGETLRRQPDDHRSLVLLGHLRNQAGQAHEALNCYLEAIRLGAEAAPLSGIMERLVALLQSRGAGGPAAEEELPVFTVQEEG